MAVHRRRLAGSDHDFYKPCLAVLEQQAIVVWGEVQKDRCEQRTHRRSRVIHRPVIAEHAAALAGWRLPADQRSNRVRAPLIDGEGRRGAQGARRQRGVRARRERCGVRVRREWRPVDAPVGGLDGC